MSLQNMLSTMLTMLVFIVAYCLHSNVSFRLHGSKQCKNCDGFWRSMTASLSMTSNSNSNDLSKKNYGFSARVLKKTISSPVEEIPPVSQVVVQAITQEVAVADAPISETVIVSDLPETDSSDLFSDVELLPVEENTLSESMHSDVTYVIDSEVIEVEVAVPEVSPEEKFRLKIAEDTKARNERMKNLSQLQMKLSKSVAKKQEVEQLMVNEIDSLRSLIQSEIEGATSRLVQLESLFESFLSIYLSKNALVGSETKILEQMKAVRDMISEQVVLVQLDAAVVKKEELINIERSICTDVKSASDQINVEISDTKEKIASLRSVYKSFPSINDEGYASRSYSWEDIESLQEKLMLTVENSIERDRKIQRFGEVFESVLRRKGLILGENTAIPSDVAESLASSGTAQTMQSDEEEEEELRPAKPSMSLAELTEILKQQNQAELSATAVEAVRRGSQSFLAATSSAVSASVQSLRSSEGQESRKAFAVALDAAGNVGRSVVGVWNVARSLWTNELGDQSKIESTDEYFKRASTALKSIVNSEEVKQSLASAGENSKKSSQELGAATSLLAKKIGSELSESETWNKAVADLASSVSMLLATISAGAVKTVFSRQERQLPPPSRED